MILLPFQAMVDHGGQSLASGFGEKGEGPQSRPNTIGELIYTVVLECVD
jgi:hypothetical protein